MVEKEFACDCMEQTKQRIKELYKEKLGDTVSGELDVHFENETILFGPNDYLSSVAVGLPIVIKYNWETKGGKLKEKRETVSVLPSFCPHCGKPLKKAKKEEKKEDVKNDSVGMRGPELEPLI